MRDTRVYDIREIVEYMIFREKRTLMYILVDERWRVCVGHGVLGGSDGGESVCVR